MAVRHRRTVHRHSPLVSTRPGRRAPVAFAQRSNAHQNIASHGIEGGCVSLLEVHNVSISFDAVRVLDDLSFPLEPGELRFLIGPNDAGRTLLIDVITGQTRPR